MNEKYTFNLDIIKDTIYKLGDIVRPSMGAKGRMALIERGGFDKPLITDDGVTIAKEARNVFDINERPIYNLLIEAMHNVEKVAKDGTTLTILMLEEFYKLALEGIKHEDPQEISEYIKELSLHIIKELEKNKLTEINKSIIKSVATVSTKMPLIGNMIADAWEVAGDDMNIIIEHDRRGDYQHQIVVEEGFTLDNSGWNMDEFISLTNDEQHTKTEFKDARLIMLSAGGLEQKFAMDFFRSIKKNKDGSFPPLVFFIPKSFNPIDLVYILNTLNATNEELIKNKQAPIQFQFVIMSGANTDRMYHDLAAYTNGKIQDVTLGTREYKFEHSGYAKFISITQHNTVIVPNKELDNSVAVGNRIKLYKDFLENNKFELGEIDEVDIKKQLSSLTSGIVKIKLALPTRSNFEFIKLKLDDAIGTVKHVCKSGYIHGGGTALANIIGKTNENINEFLLAPRKQIIKNAGLVCPEPQDLKEDELLNVKTNTIEKASENGIYDSFEAYKQALLQASSIISQLILTYVYIKRQ